MPITQLPSVVQVRSGGADDAFRKREHYGLRAGLEPQTPAAVTKLIETAAEGDDEAARLM